MQKLQYLLQPSMIETNAVAPSARGAGRLIELLDLGEAHIDDRRPVRRSSAIMSGRRCRSADRTPDPRTARAR